MRKAFSQNAYSQPALLKVGMKIAFSYIFAIMDMTVKSSVQPETVYLVICFSLNRLHAARRCPMAITKTDFMRGMQCRKMLWLDKHKPGLRVIPPEIQARLDAGNEFGDRAMGMFGPYEEMTVYLPGKKIPDKKAMAAKTQDAIARGVSVICEAAFINYNNYCAADILRKTEQGYDLYEVKNAPEVHEQFVRDAAFQYYIITRCGLKIGRICIITHGQYEENPFVTTDITRQAKGLYRWINDNIWDLNRMQKETEEVCVPAGEQCTQPYECWYFGYCHQTKAADKEIEQ